MNALHQFVFLTFIALIKLNTYQGRNITHGLGFLHQTFEINHSIWLLLQRRGNEIVLVLDVLHNLRV